MLGHNIKTVSMVGAGNVATHLATALFNKGIVISEIWSRHLLNAESLAKKTEAAVCNDLHKLGLGSDLIIVSVKDDVAADVISQLPKGLKAVVHTSGGLDMKILENVSLNIGVFYPLQSFNKDEIITWDEVPVCVEGNNDKFTDILFELGNKLSSSVQYVNSTQRKHLHVAAVIANNFTNYLYSVAHDLTVKSYLPFSILVPLIKQTVKRLDGNDPIGFQTGPAKRNDEELIKKHVELLKDEPEIAQLYSYLSEMIIKKTGN